MGLLRALPPALTYCEKATAHKVTSAASRTIQTKYNRNTTPVESPTCTTPPSKWKCTVNYSLIARGMQKAPQAVAPGRPQCHSKEQKGKFQPRNLHLSRTESDGKICSRATLERNITLLNLHKPTQSNLLVTSEEHA